MSILKGRAQEVEKRLHKKSVAESSATRDALPGREYTTSARKRAFKEVVNEWLSSYFECEHGGRHEWALTLDSAALLTVTALVSKGLSPEHILVPQPSMKQRRAMQGSTAESA